MESVAQILAATLILYAWFWRSSAKFWRERSDYWRKAHGEVLNSWGEAIDTNKKLLCLLDQPREQHVAKSARPSKGSKEWKN